MDRFIADLQDRYASLSDDLKSNMDRFISVISAF